MGTFKKCLGKSLSAILDEEITPDKVLAGNKKRVGYNSDRVKWKLYKEYLNHKENFTEPRKCDSK